MNAHAPEQRRTSAEEYGTFGADYRFAPIEETRDSGLRQLVKCWSDIRGDRAMPTRPEVNPFALRGLLRFTQMFDVIDAGRDFRYRVVGSGIFEQTGLQLTGKCVSELEEPLRSRMLTALSAVVTGEVPVRLVSDRSAVRQIAYKRTEAVFLPLGEAVTTHILSGVTFHGRRLAG